MIHVFGNEFNRKVEVVDFEDEQELISSLEDKFYQIVFLNILQAGLPGELDIIQDIHIQNPGTIYMSLCPEERYMYYRDVAQEFAYLQDPIRYEKLKIDLMRAMKEIDFREKRRGFEDKYISIQLKRRTDIVEIDRITYVEKTRYSTIIHTLDRDYYSFKDCKELYKKLEGKPNQFILTDEKHIINFYHLYDMEKYTKSYKSFKRKKAQFFAVMKGYAHVPIKEVYYNKLLKRFVNEIVKGKKVNQNLSKTSI
jgi:DNA-binding LytR/AlgR family response regulator